MLWLTFRIIGQTLNLFLILEDSSADHLIVIVSPHFYNAYMTAYDHNWLFGVASYCMYRVIVFRQQDHSSVFLCIHMNYFGTNCRHNKISAGKKTNKYILYLLQRNAQKDLTVFFFCLKMNGFASMVQSTKYPSVYSLEKEMETMGSRLNLLYHVTRRYWPSKNLIFPRVSPVTI